jgi:hypothetical protein
LLEKINIKYEERKDCINQSFIWLLISLAEINKKKLGKSVHIENFIEEGIYIYLNTENKINITELEDSIKIDYLCMIIDQIKSNVHVKWLISKDATASCYQH